MDKMEFENACYEVLEILKCIKKEDLLKIPQEEIQMLKKYANYNHNFHYNCSKDIKEQNVSKLAKGIIAQYFFEYIATDVQKEKIKLKQKYNFQIIENEKEKMYAYEKIFDNNKIKSVKQEKNDNSLPIKYKKENLFIKIFNKILNFFNRSKKYF